MLTFKPSARRRCLIKTGFSSPTATLPITKPSIIRATHTCINTEVPLEELTGAPACVCSTNTGFGTWEHSRRSNSNPFCLGQVYELLELSCVSSFCLQGVWPAIKRHEESGTELSLLTHLSRVCVRWAAWVTRRVQKYTSRAPTASNKSLGWENKSCLL